MRIHACHDLTNVSAQGGNNAWTGAVLGPPPLGTSVSLRKATGGKNTVNIWTVGSLTSGTDIDLPITITGTIKAKTPCGTVVGLLGSWSAKSTSAIYGGLDSDYTGTSTVTVGPDPCIYIRFFGSAAASVLRWSFSDEARYSPPLATRRFQSIGPNAIDLSTPPISKYEIEVQCKAPSPMSEKVPERRVVDIVAHRLRIPDDSSD